MRLAGLPDNRFDSVDLLDIVKLIEGEIAAVGPTTVFTHHGADLNVDHRRTHDAVLAATRPLPGTTIAEVLAAADEWRSPPGSVDEVFAADQWARTRAAAVVGATELNQ